MVESEDLSTWVQGQTVTGWFRDAVRDRGDQGALRIKADDGSWRSTTWAQLGDQAARGAGALPTSPTSAPCCCAPPR
ncbi:MAG: hypothetical protein MUC45_06955 [Actinomycetia bacterium]|nr:hypothetical protein [Actinomycetes bacterium]